MYLVGVEFAFCVDIWPGSGGWWPKRVQTRRSQQSWSLPPSFPSWNCLSSLNFKLSRFFRKSFFWLFCFVSFLLLTPSSSRCPPLSAICNSGIILVFTPFCLSLVYHTVNASFPPHGLSSIHPRVLLPRFLPHYSVFISVQYCEPSNNFLALVCFLFLSLCFFIPSPLTLQPGSWARILFSTPVSLTGMCCLYINTTKGLIRTCLHKDKALWLLKQHCWGIWETGILIKFSVWFRGIPEEKSQRKRF